LSMACPRGYRRNFYGIDWCYFMKAVIQRVSKASVAVEGRVISNIGLGMVILIGFSSGDSFQDIGPMVGKILNLRIFEDDQGRMNRSLLDVGGEILLVSQFTLAGDIQKGRRPSFTKAAPPEVAQKLYRAFIEELRNRNVPFQTGQFQAHMEVMIHNDGPVTFIIER
jgi:D-tyrosyl-tRNA(Tyr) deacylase